MGKTSTIKMTTTAEHYEVFAICTNLNVFQFCVAINQLFSIDLQAQKDVTLTLNGKTVQPFSFSAVNINDNITITVIDNDAKQNTVLDFYKNISFFVKFSPIISDSQTTEIQEILAKEKEFLFVQKLNVSTLSKSNANAANALFQIL
ncbi:MAG: hypothetical protein MJ198_02315 [Bacteroidales bacterium]|nr:hypothetical protein [Bacteroidales bacterium]